MHLLEAGRIPTQAIASLRTGNNKCATALVDGLAAAAAAAAAPARRVKRYFLKMFVFLNGGGS